MALPQNKCKAGTKHKDDSTVDLSTLCSSLHLPTRRMITFLVDSAAVTGWLTENNLQL